MVTKAWIGQVQKCKIEVAPNRYLEVVQRHRHEMKTFIDFETRKVLYLFSAWSLVKLKSLDRGTRLQTSLTTTLR